MPKRKYRCLQCDRGFLRYECAVRDPNRVFCSHLCVNDYMKTASRGSNNPGFKHGKYIKVKDLNPVNKNKHWRLRDTTTPEKVEQAIATSTSFIEASKKLGISRQTVKSRAEQYKIDISHFCSCSSRPGGPDKYLRKGSTDNRAVVRATILKHDLIPYICKICGQTDSWNGNTLVLQLDHIDGDKTNNEITNLRFLCSNCHSQTPTYTGRNSRRKEGI